MLAVWRELFSELRKVPLPSRVCISYVCASVRRFVTPSLIVPYPTTLLSLLLLSPATHARVIHLCCRSSSPLLGLFPLLALGSWLLCAYFCCGGIHREGVRAADPACGWAGPVLRGWVRVFDTPSGVPREVRFAPSGMLLRYSTAFDSSCSCTVVVSACRWRPYLVNVGARVLWYVQYAGMMCTCSALQCASESVRVDGSISSQLVSVV